MTISDVDLEARLRDLGARADEISPAPADLADRVRDRHRALRRREAGLATAALAAVLVLVGVPVVASTMADGDSSHAAAPSVPRSAATLAELPTRGSLAGDAEWVRGVKELSWRSLDEPYQVPADVAATLPDPPVDARVVAYAGDVPGGRVALVLGRSGRPGSAWFTGPEGARPDQMALATLPAESQVGRSAALEYSPERVSASGTATLVLVGWPGDEVDQLTSRTVSAGGETTEHWARLSMKDGAAAVATRWLAPEQPAPELRIHRTGRPVEALHPDITLVDVPAGVGPTPVDVADPKGLRSSVADDDLRVAVEAMTSFYVARPEDLHATLLAGGPVTGDPESSSVLVGFTFPSGATAASLVTTHRAQGEDGASYSITRTRVAPAGVPVPDRILAVPGPDSLTVQGPASAVLAEVYDRTGTQLGRVPLTGGTGSARVSAAAPGATVRFLDAGGTVLIQSPITGIVR